MTFVIMYREMGWRKISNVITASIGCCCMSYFSIFINKKAYVCILHHKRFSTLAPSLHKSFELILKTIHSISILHNYFLLICYFLLYSFPYPSLSLMSLNKPNSLAFFHFFIFSLINYTVAFYEILWLFYYLFPFYTITFH